MGIKARRAGLHSRDNAIAKSGIRIQDSGLRSENFQYGELSGESVEAAVETAVLLSHSPEF